MKIKLFDRINPAAAYRQHGPRYGFYVFSKAALLVLNFLLATFSLIASFADWGLYSLCEQAVMLVLKMMAVLVPFLLFEFFYWWYRLRRLSRTAESCQR